MCDIQNDHPIEEKVNHIITLFHSMNSLLTYLLTFIGQNDMFLEKIMDEEKKENFQKTGFQCYWRWDQIFLSIKPDLQKILTKDLIGPFPNFIYISSLVPIFY